jgi:antitoxin VapB
MTHTAAVFMSGNSQAVRLPKEFQFQSTRVHIERRGNEVVLREVVPTLREALKNMPELSIEDKKDWAGVEEQLDDKPPQERDWGGLLATDLNSEP